MKMLSHLQYLLDFNFSNFTICEHFMYGKQARPSHKKSCAKQNNEPLELVHCDVCGPMPTISLGGALYFITFIDDATLKGFVV